MTRQLSGTKIEFMEPIKPLGKKSGMLLKGFLRALPCKEGYFLLGTRTSGYLEGLEETDSLIKIDIAGEVFLPSRGFYKFSLQFLMRSSRKAN